MYLICNKIILFIAVYSLQCLNTPLKAQPDTSKTNIIFNKHSPKKGIYQNFEEFRSNNPAMSYNAIVVKTRETVTTKDSILEVYKLEFPKKMKISIENGSPIWGFSDGKNVYIARKNNFSKNLRYDKLKYIGRYCYYQTGGSYNTSQFSHPGASGNVNTTKGGKPRELLEKAIDINTGEHFELTKNKLREILSHDVQLLNAYLMERENDKKYMMPHYLILYAEKHIEEINFR
ncbi:MAG: hypothetical protein NZ529_01230 [Cytophagaceae bacterium]|nr:hypothetical protein [Cytophagaceae bacterium]MDW8455387.1 hypothetical protein [Cytophagaceae bacterium]